MILQLLLACLVALAGIGSAQTLPFPISPYGQANPTFCFPITIDKTKVPSTLTNYPSMFRSAVGTVNTVTTAVTLATGDQFPAYYSNGAPIGINGVTYLISVRTSGTALVLQSSAGTQTGVSYTSTPFLATIANGGKVQNASGFDIGYYSDSACSTKLDWETETWSNVGTGVWWYRVASLSSSVDTVVYLGYGNASTTTDQSNKTGVWNSNYKGVWHLASTAESTSGGFTLTAFNGPTAGTGQVNGDFAFVKASSQYFGNSNAPVTTFPLTLQGWLKLADTTFGTGESRAVVSIQQPSTLDTFLLDWVENSTQLFIRSVALQASGVVVRQYLFGGTPDTNWHLLTATFTDSSTGTIYQDGTNLSPSVNGGAATPAGLSSVSIGAVARTSPVSYMGGQLDEIRIRNDVQTQDWTTTDYNLMSSPFTFWSTTAQ